MSTPAQALARFVSELQFEDIPGAVAERAKDCAKKSHLPAAAFSIEGTVPSMRM